MVSTLVEQQDKERAAKQRLLPAKQLYEQLTSFRRQRSPIRCS